MWAFFNIAQNINISPKKIDQFSSDSVGNRCLFTQNIGLHSYFLENGINKLWWSLSVILSIVTHETLKYSHDLPFYCHTQPYLGL